jgi:hypothetical protein
MANDDDPHVYVPKPMEDARFLANELAVMANELERARALSGRAQEAALDTAINIANSSALWSKRDDFSGPSQALMELAKRIAWRERDAPLIGPADIARLSDLSEKARSIERRRFLSQYSEAVGAFKAALAQLDRAWHYEEVRPRFLRVFSGGRAD